MKVKIWVVSGSCGNYSDRVEWNVCAYISKKDAQEHTANAQVKAIRLHNQYSYCDIPKGANEYDPDMVSDYTGTTYYCKMIELRDAPLGLAAWTKLQE